MGCMRTLKDKSTEVLDAEAVYTGAAFKTEMYNQVRGVVNADKGGTLDFEESEDGVNWIKTDTESITGGTPLAFAFVCHAYYARVKLTNGDEAQTALNLQVYADPFE